MTNRIVITMLLCIAAVQPAAVAVSDYAAEVVEIGGSFGPYPYHDPAAVLGKPAVECINDDVNTEDATFHVKLVEAAYHLDVDQQHVVTTLQPGAFIVVKFDHKVVDFPQNPYGQDLIVFGNAAFKVQMEAGQSVGDASNMNSLFLTSPAEVSFEEVTVSVSQDGRIWHTFDNGPWADDLYPTQAYQWDRRNARWTDSEMDFTRPVDPNLSLAAFDGLSAADAIALYDGSGGGTPYDLQDLPGYDELIPDPNSGFRWIQYVRLEGGEGIYALGGEVDAVADVATCGDPTHPIPPGDITADCRVNLEDFAVLAENWLACTYRCDR